MSEKTVYVHQVENEAGDTKKFEMTSLTGPWVDREIARAAEYGFTKYNGVIGSRTGNFKAVAI
jgi:hypothetical protein